MMTGVFRTRTALTPVRNGMTMNVQATCFTHAASSAKRMYGKQRKSLSIKAIAVGVVLALTAASAGAESADDASDALQSFAATDGDSAQANLNDETARLPMRKYSPNLRTNERINAVFHIIETQGNGLVWDSDNDESAAPPIVAAKATPPKAASSSTATKTLAAAPIVASSSAATASTPASSATASAASSDIATASASASSTIATASASASSTIAATAPANASGTVAAAAPAPSSSTVAAAVPPAPPVLTWAFRSTLQDTLTAWAREAGWNDPKWKASNPYQIVDAAPIQGTFMDALRAVANAAPQIDITASTAQRELVVTNAHVN